MYNPKQDERVKTQYVSGGEFFEGTAKMRLSGGMTLVLFDGAQVAYPWPNEQLSPALR